MRSEHFFFYIKSRDFKKTDNIYYETNQSTQIEEIISILTYQDHYTDPVRAMICN